MEKETDISEEDRAAQEEEARKFFAGPCDFVAGADTLVRLPPLGLPEVAFAGRSNVGKSSLVNALTGRKTLARTSNTPGRTQQLNFFLLSEKIHLVDMPGYGYAKVSKTQKAAWAELIGGYLRGRATLRCVFLLVDSRHGLKDSDREVMRMLDAAAVSYRIALTKADKTSGKDLAETIEKIETEIKKHPAAFLRVYATSAEKGQGIPEFRCVIRDQADGS